jgi:uncharacterized membrane protein
MDSRLPKLFFLVLAVYAAIHFSSYYPQLPAVVASHFSARGAANGWQAKSVFFGTFITMAVLAAMIAFGVPRIVAAMPVHLINLPNKDYWFAREHLAETQESLNTYFAWFGCALYLILILTFDYALQYNLRPENPPDVSRVWCVLSGFTAFMVVWIVRLYTRFGRVPRQNVRS